MKLREMKREGNKIPHVLAVRVDGAPEILDYGFPEFSPSGKLCDWGQRAEASSGIGHWINPDRIEVVEIIS